MENIEDWKKAGKIAGQVLQYGKGLIVKGASYLDVIEKIEAKIKELGGEPAFPPQMSMNDVAAHFTVDADEDVKFENQVVSLDVGVHINGAIGDTACTVDLSGKYHELVKASEEALKEAIKIIKPGVKVSEIGKIIEETIKRFGFVPIRNLSGHGLDLYNIHSAPSIPNYDNGSSETLKKGQIIAIEPFATNGAGLIYETDRANIFSVVKKKPIRSATARRVLKEIESYNGLPFTTRNIKVPMAAIGLRELEQAGIIRAYPPLPDKNHGIVTQAEHSLIVDDEAVVLTKP